MEALHFGCVTQVYLQQIRAYRLTFFRHLKNGKIFTKPETCWQNKFLPTAVSTTSLPKLLKASPIEPTLSFKCSSPVDSNWPLTRTAKVKNTKVKLKNFILQNFCVDNSSVSSTMSCETPAKFLNQNFDPFNTWNNFKRPLARDNWKVFKQTARIKAKLII